MAMALPRPSTCGTRPAYLDNLFRQPSHSEPPSRREPYKSMPHSSASSLDLRSQFSQAETLPPPYESDEDKGSVRSLRLNLSPRFNVKKVFNRRTYPQAKEMIGNALQGSRSGQTTPPSRSQSSSRRPSLPKLQTSFGGTSLSSPRRKGSLVSVQAPKDKPLPAPPVEPAKEMSCHRCYYFAARNCNGWVMGGTHGDACEQCLVSSERARFTTRPPF